MLAETCVDVKPSESYGFQPIQYLLLPLRRLAFDRATSRTRLYAELCCQGHHVGVYPAERPRARPACRLPSCLRKLT